MVELIPTDDDDDFEEPVYDFGTKENILIHVCKGGYTFGVEVIEIITPDGRNPGWVSCDYNHDGPLDYMISNQLEQSVFDVDGFYMIEGATGEYIRGDGWTTDDDAELCFETVRLATPEEYDAYTEYLG